jgi:hypothetical protein
MGFAVLAAYVLLKGRRDLINVRFGIGMGLLAAMGFENLVTLEKT